MKILYHVLFWTAVYLCWVFLLGNHSFALTRTMSVEFCYLAFITADYYILGDVLVPRLFLRKKYVYFAAAVAALLALSAGLRAVVALQMNSRFFHSPTDVRTLYVDSLVNISLWVLLFTGGKTLLDRLGHQQQLERLERERVSSELDYLKAQINPHSLFNSLNTVYGHIDKGNQVARDVLLQFSELLRYQLYDCGADRVSLGKELDYIRNYVAFQRLRKNPRLLVDVEVRHEGPELEIAPLLLIVLVENAFKFVSNFPDRENRISIRMHTQGRTFYSSIVNTKELLQGIVTERSGGIGIANLRRRLELLYGKKHTFTTEAGTDFYKADLIIDLT